MFRKSLVVLVVAGLLASLGLLASAVFTATATVDNNTFTTGTLTLTATPATAALTLNSIVPGDSVTAPIAVNNAGSLDLRYAMTSNSTNVDSKNLATVMLLGIKTGVTTCTTGGFSANGTTLYTGTLTAASFGNPAQGSQAGDRALAAAANETLCFQATLPLTTTNAYQGAATTTTFTFTAEQTANNP